MTTLENRADAHWVMNLRLLGLLLITAHCVVADWHVVLAGRIAPGSSTTHLWLPIALITAVHVGVSIAWYKCSGKTAGLVLLIFLAVALIFGSYEHLWGPGPNNVFRVAPGALDATFRLSVALLSVLEVMGLWVALRVLKG